MCTGRDSHQRLESRDTERGCETRGPGSRGTTRRGGEGAPHSRSRPLPETRPAQQGNPGIRESRALQPSGCQQPPETPPTSRESLASESREDHWARAGIGGEAMCSGPHPGLRDLGVNPVSSPCCGLGHWTQPGYPLASWSHHSPGIAPSELRQLGLCFFCLSLVTQ